MFSVTATFLPTAGTLTVFGDALDNNIVVSRDAAGKILVNGGAVSVLGREELSGFESERGLVAVWGRGFWPDPDDSGFPGVYDEGLLDQVARAQQLGRAEMALTLSRKLAQLVPRGESDARVLESLRMLHKREDAVEYLSGLSRERRSEPSINVVLALFERDAGNDVLARNLLGSVVRFFPDTPAARAVEASIGDWPHDLNAMTASGTDQAGR